MGTSIIRLLGSFGLKNWLLGGAGVLLAAFAVNAVNARDARVAAEAIQAVRQVQLDSVSVLVDSLLLEDERSEAEHLVAIQFLEVVADEAEQEADRELALQSALSVRLEAMISDSAKVVLDSMNEMAFAVVLDLTAVSQAKDDMIALLYRKIDTQTIVINAMRTERSLLRTELEFWQNRKEPSSLFNIPIKLLGGYGVIKLAEELF